MTRITVTRLPSGAFSIWQNGRNSGPLCMGEMIEQTLKLLVPNMPGSPYPMRTDDEWSALGFHIPTSTAESETTA